MKRCPACNATLPDTAVRCQFCGHAISGPPPVRLDGTRASRRSDVAPGAPPWVGTAYNLIALYWVLSGGWSVVSSLLSGEKGGSGVIGAAFAMLTVLVGLGLLLRIELIRGIVNFLCGLQILFGILGVVMSFLAGQPLGLVLAFVQIATAGFMMFLIGETETRPPNL